MRDAGLSWRDRGRCIDRPHDLMLSPAFSSFRRNSDQRLQTPPIRIIDIPLGAFPNLSNPFEETCQLSVLGMKDCIFDVLCPSSFLLQRAAKLALTLSINLPIKAEPACFQPFVADDESSRLQIELRQLIETAQKLSPLVHTQMQCDSHSCCAYCPGPN
jgi:hypothetical protein